MPRVDLPDGHHAEIRDIADLRRGDVRAAYRMADESGINLLKGMGVDALGALQDAIVVRFVRRWTLTDKITKKADDATGKPLPVSMATVANLPLGYYQPLADATGPAFAQVVNQDAGPDPKLEPSSSPPDSTD